MADLTRRQMLFGISAAAVAAAVPAIAAEIPALEWQSAVADRWVMLNKTQRWIVTVNRMPPGTLQWVEVKDPADG